MTFRRIMAVGMITLFVPLVSVIDGFIYPNSARNSSVQDNYHGIVVPDPYRWLEDKDAEATKSFVMAQNNLSQSYFQKCPFRTQITERLLDTWNYKRNDPPEKFGNHFFQYGNGVLYMQDALEGPNINRRVFLDPNTLSDDGTVTLTGTQSFSKDGEVFAYGISVSGTDWRKVCFRNVSSNVLLEDVLIKVKFTDLVWKGNEGIFYGHYPDFEGEPEGSDTGTNENQKISYHKLGTSQDEDIVVVEFPEKPKNLIAIGMDITKHSPYHLIITPSASDDEGSYGDNTIHYVDLGSNEPTKWEKRPIVDSFNAVYKYITDVNGTCYFLTNLNAPRFKIVGIQLSSPEPESWTTLVDEDGENVLNWAAPINREYILLNYLDNVSSKLILRSIHPNHIRMLHVKSSRNVISMQLIFKLLVH